MKFLTKTVVVLLFGLVAARPQDLPFELPDISELPSPQEFLTDGGQALADAVRTASPDNVTIPPAVRDGIANVDTEAAATLIENGSQFVQDNAANVAAFVGSLFSG